MKKILEIGFKIRFKIIFFGGTYWNGKCEKNRFHKLVILG